MHHVSVVGQSHVVLASVYPPKLLVSDGQLLCRHLMSRKNLSRVQESRKRRGLIRAVPGVVCNGFGLYQSMTTREYRSTGIVTLSLFSPLPFTPFLHSHSASPWNDQQKHKDEDTVESVLR